MKKVLDGLGLNANRGGDRALEDGPLDNLVTTLYRSIYTTQQMQGCQMVCFQTQNPNLGKFWKALLRKILVYFMTIWSMLWPLEIFYIHLVYFVVILYIFPRFGILDREKSGNPEQMDGSIARCRTSRHAKNRINPFFMSYDTTRSCRMMRNSLISVGLCK
jgi:hypothetical protein